MDSSFAPLANGRRRPIFRWLRGLCSGVVSLACTASVFAAKEPSLITGEKKSYGYSWQQELQLGAESDKEITEQMGLYENPEVQAYVAAVGNRVLQQSDFNSPTAPEIYRNTKFTFRVLDDPVVNAFALPGGYIYVTRGLLTHVENEAQLATVLGHEIGHVAARHSSQQARRSQWSQIGLIAGAILGQQILGNKVPDIGQSVLQLGGQTLEMFMLRYSREAENEADTLGVNYALRSGYAAGESARFFQSLQRIGEREGKALPTWQSTHPDPGDRAQHVLQIASSMPQGYATNIGEDAFLPHIDGMVIGEDPREGFARNGIFYHPTLHFQFPVAGGWKVDNQRAAVVMAEPNGRAMMGLKLAPGARARDAATQFAQQSKVQVTASGDTAVNGLPTTVIIGQAQTDQGNVGVWDAFIEFEGKVYSLLGYAPTQVFEQMRPTFESVAGGFSPLRDASIANVQPAKIRLVRADRAAPFASFVPTSLPPEITAEEVAIMNQTALNDQVNQGRVLKIPDVQAAPATTTASAPTQQPQRQQPAYPASYPAQTQYPNPPYPQQPQTYPQSYPPAQTYPPQTGYPQPNYPPQTTYPQQYPQGTPPPQQYPPQQYPQQYPPQGYPTGTSYPAQSPQWPQSSPSTTTTQPTQPQPQRQPQPTWPR